MDHVFQVLGAEIYRYGGEVDQFRGDGLVAFFGVQTAHEDDAERAVLAALAMQAAVKRYAAELAEQEGGPAELALRVGVNTGEVVAAHVGDRARHSEDTAMGRAIALAARMETAAEPGTVLVTGHTYRLVAPLFEWEALGEIAVKGVRVPVAAYRPLARATAVRDKARGIPGLDSPLVGRDAERRVLREAIERLSAGVGSIVTVVGEAGIGKSRLVAECRDGAHRGEVTPPLQWVEGRCLSYATGVAYQVWLDMLRGLLGVAPDAAPGAVQDALRERVWATCGDRFGDVYPYLGRMMSLPLEEDAETRLRGLDAEGLRYVTFCAVETLLEAAARQRPLVVVCEDLHWADPTSLALLEHLLPLTDRAPLSLVCVFRPLTEHGCWQVRETVARDYRHRYADLWLAPLSETQSAELVGNLLRVEDLAPKLRERILEHAEGNPFYVEEILRALIDEGTIVHDEGADPSATLCATASGPAPEPSGVGRTGRWFSTRDVADITIPDTVQGVIGGRIDRLPGGARRTLQLASVIGRVFSHPVLAAIAPSPPPHPSGVPPAGDREASRQGREGSSTLDAHLVTLQRAQMIRERARVPEREYIFKHHLTQEAAYSGLLRRERRAYHRCVAEALERLYPDRVEEQLGLLARHWERAGESARAAGYARRAGEQAAAQFANEEAIEYLTRALDLTPEEDLAGRYALLLCRETVYELVGNREAQRRDLQTLEALAEILDRSVSAPAGEGSRRAEVALRQSRCATRTGDDGAALAAAQEAVRLARAAGDVRREAAGQREWGRALHHQQKHEAALSHLERALVLAEAAGLGQVQVEVMHTFGTAFQMQGDDERARACWEQELRICRQTGNRKSEGEALRDVGVALLSLGDWTGGEAHLRQALQVCRETGNRRDEAWAHFFLAAVPSLRGDYAGAEIHQEQALCIAREVNDRVCESATLGWSGLCRILEADYAGARETLAQSLRLCRERGDLRGTRRALCFLGLLFDVLGNYAASATHYEQALRIDREISNQGGDGRVLFGKGLLAHHLGDDRAGQAYSQRAIEILQEQDSALLQGDSMTVLGHAQAGLGQLDEAAGAYRRALDVVRQQDQHHLTSEPLAGLARLALSQGDPGQALVHVEEILACMETRPGLEGAWEPLRVYLTCYRVLRANGDPRAEGILDAAYRLLQERAANVDDEALRRSYLENVAAHCEIVAAWNERSMT